VESLHRKLRQFLLFGALCQGGNYSVRLLAFCTVPTTSAITSLPVCPCSSASRTRRGLLIADKQIRKPRSLSRGAAAAAAAAGLVRTRLDRVKYITGRYKPA
jgi:hypothetical protein